MALSDAVAFAVAAWTLDEASGTRNDSIGSRHLTDNNTVASAAGKFNNAADFEASNSESLSRANDTTLAGADVEFMLRMWVKAESLVNFPVVICCGNSSVVLESYVLYYDTTASKWTWEVSSGGAATSVQWGSAASTATDYLIHVWHSASANQIGIAVNAGTAVTASHSTGVQQGTGDFQIGARANQSLYWDGLIDDVVILKGYILDATERSADYNSGTGVAFADWSGGAPAPSRRVRRLMTLGVH